MSEQCKHYFGNLNGDEKIDNVKCDHCGMTYYQFMSREISYWKQEYIELRTKQAIINNELKNQIDHRVKTEQQLQAHNALLVKALKKAGTYIVQREQFGGKIYDQLLEDISNALLTTPKEALLAAEAKDKEIEQLRKITQWAEPSTKAMEEALGEQQEIFAYGGTIRRCIDCGTPVFGGPTQCSFCVGKKVGAARSKAAETHIKALRAYNARLLRAVKWMKSIGEHFAYKAPEQIDACKLVGAMSETAKDALAGSPTDALNWTEQLIASVVFVVDTFKHDMTQGYVTKDKQFAVDILSKALASNPKEITGAVTKLVTALEEALHHDYITPELHEALREYRGMK